MNLKNPFFEIIHVIQSRLVITEGVGYIKIQMSCILFIMHMMTHFGHCGPHLQVTKMYIEENYTQYDHSIGAYCKPSTRSRCLLDYTQWRKKNAFK